MLIQGRDTGIVQSVFPLRGISSAFVTLQCLLAFFPPQHPGWYEEYGKMARAWPEKRDLKFQFLSLVLGINPNILFKTIACMQSKPTSTHRKSNYAKQRRALQQKATTGKQKTSSTVTINLEEKWLDKQEVLQLLQISDSTLLK